MNFLNWYPALIGLVGVVSVSSHLLLSNAAQTQPAAQFAFTATEGRAPLSVSFANSSSHADEFRWDFGDGTVASTLSVSEAVTHEYADQGIYTVTLTAIRDGIPPQLNVETLVVKVTSTYRTDMSPEEAPDTSTPVGSITLSPQPEGELSTLAQVPVFASRSIAELAQDNQGIGEFAQDFSSPIPYRSDEAGSESQGNSQAQVTAGDSLGSNATGDSRSLGNFTTGTALSDSGQPVTGLDAVRELFRQYLQKLSLSRLLAYLTIALSMIQLLPLLVTALISVAIGGLCWWQLPDRFCWTGLAVIALGLASSVIMFA